MPNLVGLSIATRSDCINEECLNYLKDLNTRTNLTIELGLQSMYDETLKYINRGHDLNNFITCVKKLKESNMKTKMILQVHDELIFDVFKDELDMVKEIVKETMEGVCKMSVPLKVDIEVGTDWYLSLIHI